MAGQVLVNEQRLDKPGIQIKHNTRMRLKQKRGRYVSRAGEKLAAALTAFRVSPSAKTCLDIGSSTGGFTDCLLQHGASRVYAVDVGTNQLVWQLRTDPRVISLEQTHARTLTKQLVPDPIEVLVVDVSFTSMKYVLPKAIPLLSSGAQAVCLFKPQFEVERAKVQPGGQVDERDALTSLTDMLDWLKMTGLAVNGQIRSPVKGLHGNQEYLLHLSL